MVKINKAIKALAKAENQLVQKSFRKSKPKKKKKNLVKQLLETGGEIAGGYFGQPFLGRSAGQFISKITGNGKYKKKKRGVKGCPGSFSDPLMQRVRIQHREMIGTVASSVSFSSNVYPVNPGQSSFLPVGSNLAANFESYQIRKMVVEVESTMVNAISSTNPNIGTIGGAFFYDVSEALPNTIEGVQNYTGNVSTKPINNLIVGYEGKQASYKPTGGKYFVRPGAVPSGSDIKLYDAANFLIWTQGQQTTGDTIGRIWVIYDIEYSLLKQPVGGYLAYTDTFLVTSGVTSAAPLGTVDSFDPLSGSNIGTYIDGSADQIVFPKLVAPGYYSVSIQITADSGTQLGPVVTATGGCTAVVNAITGGSYVRAPSTSGTTTTTLANIVVLKTFDTIGYINVASPTITSNAQTYIRITKINPVPYTASAYLLSGFSKQQEIDKKLDLKFAELEKQTMARLLEYIELRRRSSDEHLGDLSLISDDKSVRAPSKRK